MSIQDCIAKARLWIDAKGKQAIKDSEPTEWNIRIYLDGNSIYHSFLVIENEQNPHSCWIPITPKIKLSVKLTKCLTFQFLQYSEKSYLFLLENQSELELLVSYFSRISAQSDKYLVDTFSEKNKEFLSKLSDQESLSKFAGQFTNPKMSALSPIVINPSCRDFWRQCVIQQNSQFYTGIYNLRFSFLTWNVASHQPNEKVLNDLAQSFVLPISAADVVVIAFEEIDMSVKSVVTGNTHASDKWKEYVETASSLISHSSHLMEGESPNFTLLSAESLGGVFGAIFVRNNLPIPITLEKTNAIKLGAAGMLANKAAVIFSLSCAKMKMCIVCVHLAPHEQNWEQRDEQFHEIIDQVDQNGKYDYTIMMGDMNYRNTLPYKDVCDIVKKGDLDTLLKCEQLNVSRFEKKDPVMSQFLEPPIKFPPTFKFDKGSDVYDTSGKKRVPSWTDRVLVRTSPPSQVAGIEDTINFESDSFKMCFEGINFPTDDNSHNYEIKYNFPSLPINICYRSLRNSFSDHRPVQSAYIFPAPFEDQERLSELNEIIDAKYSELVNFSRPSLKIEYINTINQTHQDSPTNSKDEDTSESNPKNGSHLPNTVNFANLQNALNLTMIPSINSPNQLQSTSGNEFGLILKNEKVVWVSWNICCPEGVTIQPVGDRLIMGGHLIMAGDSIYVRITYAEGKRPSSLQFDIVNGVSVVVRIPPIE